MDTSNPLPAGSARSHSPLVRTVPGLLVSVRSLAEAGAVAHLGIEVLDLKEPQHGPLAPAAIELWEQIADRYATTVSLSAALGEFEQALELAAHVPQSFAFAKAGPSNCGTCSELIQAWTRLRERLPCKVALVAVAYADHRAAGCPQPLQVFELAGQMGIQTWLIDTFEKDGRSTLDHMTMQALQAVSTLARSHAARWVLAGAIRLMMIPSVRDWGATPDLLGVRGDVCDGPRAGQLSPMKVRNWLTRLQHEDPPLICLTGELH